MFKSIRKLILENRLAHLAATGKDNQRIRGKVIRELKKYI